jgi:hypothetical protein
MPLGTTLALHGLDHGLLIHSATAATEQLNSQPMAAIMAVRNTQQAVTEFARPANLSSQSIAVLKSSDVATVNSNFIRFLNPNFRPPLVFPIGQPRAALNLPTLVSPTGTPTDATLFEDPQDATHKFFLTDYAIASTGAPAAAGKRVTFAPSATGFVLTVNLADVTAADKVTGNGRLASDTRYLLTATVQSRIINWDLTAAAPGADGSLSLTLALADFAARDLLYTAMTDPAAQARLIVRRSLSIALPMAAAAGRFAVSAQAIDSAIAFTFNKDLDAQVFAGLTGLGATPLAPWKVLRLNWNGRQYTYYQSASQPDQVYFLPDSFKVGRESAAPHLPNVSVTAQGDGAETMMMTLSYLAAPVWDPKRIAAAIPQLQASLLLAQPPSLAIFEAANTTLMLSLPGADPSTGAALSVQSNVLIDLAAGVQGSVTMGLTAFRRLYNDLFDPRGTLMSGEIRVTVGSDVSTAPFIARMGDLAGDIFDVQTSVDHSGNALLVTLTNAIESPIRVTGLSGVITRGGVPADGTSITNTSPALPVDLAPACSAPSNGGGAAATAAGSLTVQLGASTSDTLLKVIGVFLGGHAAADAGALVSLIVDDSCMPLFDFSQVTVQPDPKALWRAIMANGAPSPIKRAVILKFFAASLKPASAPGATDAVVAVQVVFQGGQTASFDAGSTTDAGGFMSQTVTMSVPIEAFVLQDAPTDTFTYRIDLITPGGVKRGDWATDNRDTIYIVPS